MTNLFQGIMYKRKYDEMKEEIKNPKNGLKNENNEKILCHL